MAHNQAGADTVVATATEEALKSQAFLLRATALHSLNEWKLFLHQHLRNKYIELQPGFDALPATQKKDRIYELRDFYLKIHLDEEVRGLSKTDIWAKTAGGSNLTLLYEFLYPRIEALPALIIIPAAAAMTPLIKKQRVGEA